jgi:hypothetical protein
MPKVDIDYETLDGLVVVGLKDMLSTMAEVYRDERNPDEKKRHGKDIDALERVLRLYE